MPSARKPAPTPKTLPPAAKPQVQQAVAKEPVEKSEPVPVLDKAISNRQVWDKMLAKFGKGDTPFVYDVMMSAQVEFTTPDTWTLVFEKGKEFYQITAERKLAELSAAATELAGRQIAIQLTDQTASPAAQSQAAKPASALSKAASTEAVILDEEPFAAGPFIEDSATDVANAPEEVKHILEMFPGELIA